MKTEITQQVEGRRRWPEIPADCYRVLDVGGGGGDMLARAIPEPLRWTRAAVVVDIDADAVAAGREKHPWIYFHLTSAEDMPFADENFDAVLSRVSLPLMVLPETMQEIGRVAAPGARAWFVFHGLRFALGGLWRAVKSGNPVNPGVCAVEWPAAALRGDHRALGTAVRELANRKGGAPDDGYGGICWRAHRGKGSVCGGGRENLKGER